MKPILIIADDLTGAAEIGGIAAAHGLTTTIHQGDLLKSRADATILDTDSRLLPPHAAAERVQSILSSVDPAAFSLIFKKTDSMLRGNIAAELLAAVASLNLRRALLVPQNPSRKRIIENGQYLIDRIPIHESPIAVDLETPPATSDVRRLLDPAQRLDVHCVPAGQIVRPRGITIGAAINAPEIRLWAAQRDSQTVFAGGADFFAALLGSLHLRPIATKPFVPRSQGAIVIFGSASNPSRDFVAKLANAGAIICDIPFDPAQALQQLRDAGHAFVAARSPVSSDRADQIRAAVADLVPPLLSASSVNSLIIEGGATASAVIQRLKWTTLHVKSTIAPGVVALLPAGRKTPVLILKPGTYPWPSSLESSFTRTSYSQK